MLAFESAPTKTPTSIYNNPPQIYNNRKHHGKIYQL